MALGFLPLALRSGSLLLSLILLCVGGSVCRGAPAAAAGFSVSLPSFSGCLPLGGEARGALLRYPLRLGPARRLRLRAPLTTRVAAGARLAPDLLAVLGGPCASPCLHVDGVRVVAGAPHVVPAGGQGG